MTTTSRSQSSPRTAGRAVLSPLLAASLLLGGCGSQLTHDELLQANAPAFSGRAAPPATEPSQPATDGAAATTPSVSEPSQAAVAGPPSALPAGPAVKTGANRAVSPGATATAPASQSAAARATNPRPTAAAGGPGPETSGPAGAPPARTPVPAGAPAAGTPAPADKADIVLGSIGHESGPAAAAFLPLLQAARAWVADVNSRGGLNGHRVRFVAIDDGADPNRALAAAKRLVEVDKVQALYATRTFLTGEAIVPYLEEKRVPTVVTCTCNPVDDSPMNFDVSLNEPLGGVWMHFGPLLTQTDKRKVALLYCREASICKVLRDQASKLQKDLGYEIAFEAQVSLAQPDYTAEVIAARNSGAEALVTINDNATNIRIQRSMRRQGWSVPVSGNITNYDERVLRDGGDAVEGMYLSAGVVPWSTSPLMTDYLAALAKWVPGAVKADFGAVGWVGGRLLEKIAEGFGDTVTSEDILDGLYALRAETLGGRMAPTTFGRGRHTRTNLCIIPIQIRNGEFVPKNGDNFECMPGWVPGG